MPCPIPRARPGPAHGSAGCASALGRCRKQETEPFFLCLPRSAHVRCRNGVYFSEEAVLGTGRGGGMGLLSSWPSELEGSWGGPVPSRGPWRTLAEFAAEPGPRQVTARGTSEGSVLGSVGTGRREDGCNNRKSLRFSESETEGVAPARPVLPASKRASDFTRPRSPERGSPRTPQV